jgi:hypothetical protein
VGLLNVARESDTRQPCARASGMAVLTWLDRLPWAFVNVAGSRVQPLAADPAVLCMFKDDCGFRAKAKRIPG